MPTPFARQTEQHLMEITFGQHGQAWLNREYKMQHSERRNTRRMIKEDSR